MGPSSLCGRNILKVWKPAEHIYQFLQQLPRCSENHWKGKWLGYHPGIYEPWIWKEVLCAIQRTKTDRAWLPDPHLKFTAYLRTRTRHLILYHEGLAQCFTQQGPETSCWTELILLHIARLPLAADTLWVTYREMFNCQIQGSPWAPTPLCPHRPQWLWQRWLSYKEKELIVHVSWGKATQFVKFHYA